MNSSLPDIVKLLLPFMQTYQARSGWLDMVFADERTRPNINLEGDPYVVTQAIVFRLKDWRMWADHRIALCRLIEVILESPVIDMKTYDGLLQHLTALECCEGARRGGETSKQDKVKLLFLAANTTDTAHLALEEEHCQIRDFLDKTRYGRCLEIETRFNVCYQDLTRLIREYGPDIVHFSGHGTKPDGRLVFRQEDGSATAIGTEELVEIFRVVCEEKSIKFVVFNACYAAVSANALKNIIPNVVSMQKAISDPAAIQFARHLYQGLTMAPKGMSAGQAFRNAQNMLGITYPDEKDIPILYEADEDSKQPVFRLTGCIS